MHARAAALDEQDLPRTRHGDPLHAFATTRIDTHRWPESIPGAGNTSLPARTPAWCRIVYTSAREISERNQATVAQKIQALFIDDLDGSAAEGTVRFGLDGTEYEIDLNEEHAGKLREALARYVGAARRANGAARRPVRTGRQAPAGGLNTTEVREWAKAQGIEVKDRGRVPAELVVKFKAAAGQ